MSEMLTLAIIANLATVALLCGPGRGNGNNPYCNGGSCTNPLQALGGDAKLTGALNGANPNGQSYVGSSQELACSDWTAECHWRNEPNGPGQDVMDYGQGSGKWDQMRGDIAFGTKETPNTQYAVTGATEIQDRANNAMLVSDPIGCQKGDGSLSFRYWTTKGAEVRACARKPNNGNNYMYCSPAITGGDPGPAIVRIPGPINEPFELVIESSGFIYNENGAKGGAVVVDDVVYEGDICPGEGQATDAPDNNLGPCKALFCTFDKGSCSNDNLNGWSVHDDAFGNRHTGIRAPLKGKYAVARGGGIDPVIKSSSFTLDKDQLLAFCYYRPSAESNLVVNANQKNKPTQIFKSPNFELGGQYDWNCEKTLLKKGSYDGVDFIAEGLRNEYSYMGLDEIELYDPASPKTSICQG